MTAVETALLRLAGAVVAPGFKSWLGRRRQKRERNTPLMELIGAGITDDVGLRKAERRLGDITDAVYERLLALARRRDGGLPEHEIIAALDAVGDTLQAADLSDAAILGDDVNPTRMASRLRRRLADLPLRAGLSDAAFLLYQQVLGECCTCLAQLVVQLGPFQGRATVQALERLTSVAINLDQVLARLPMTSLDAPTGTEHDAEFRTRYLTWVIKMLDHLELFGVDVRRSRMRTPLSIAYISLAITGARSSRRELRWNPGLLRQASSGDSATVRAEQALGEASRVLLRGDAGSGKTTLLQWIAVTAAGHRFTGGLEPWNGRIPFMIRLRDHVGQTLPAPERFLDMLASPIAALMPAGWVHRHLAAGALLLIDGVDEVPEAQRRGVRDWLNGLLALYPDLKVVVTSRPAAASARWLDAEGFSSVFLERMSPTDIRALIRHWHEAVRHTGDLPCDPHRLPAYEHRLLAQLAGSPHLHKLAASPLLCAMLCALNLDRDSNLPRNRMDVYRAAADMLLVRRDAMRGVPSTLPDLTSRDQFQLLQQVAWWLTLNGRTELSREEARNQIQQRLAGIRHVTASADSVLDHMIQRSGVLRQPVPDRIDFVHRTFQEYLAACEIADQGHVGNLLKHAHLDTWRETVILTVGAAHAPVRKAVFEGLLQAADDHPQRARQYRLLAGACLETAAAVDPEILKRIRSLLRGLVPRSISEARSLAGVGDPLLSELPGDLHSLTESQATATVLTAALVNGPVALDVLAGYARDARRRVQRGLISAWSYFDAAEYADRVLVDAPLDDGDVYVQHTSQLPVLSKLRHLKSVRFFSRSRVDLSQLDPVPRLTNLSLGNGFTGDLRCLAQHPDLRTVQIVAEGIPLDLAGISQLSQLRTLALLQLDQSQEISNLAKLQELTELSIAGVQIPTGFLRNFPALIEILINPPSAWRTELLSGLMGLEVLRFGNAQRPVGGFERLIERVRGYNLTGLHLYGCQWVTDLSAIGRLPRLRRLDLENTPVTDLRPLASLAELEWLWIGNAEQKFDLSPLSGLPRLKEVLISAAAPGLDLAPLAGRRMTIELDRKIKLAGSSPAGIRRRNFNFVPAVID